MQLFVSCPLVTQTGRDYNGVIALEVDPSDTVGEVKSMIHERGGLFPEKQQLSFVGETLEDDRKLSSYKIGSNCLLEETSMWIAVRIQSSKSILLSVDGRETVGSLKAMIKEKGGVPSSQETILYGNNQKLKNPKTLEESRIVNRSRLYLKILTGQSSSGCVQLFAVSELHEFTERITLEVKPSDTVEDLKYLIHEKVNIFPDQQEVIHDNMSLVNRRTLSNYNIGHQSIVILKTLLVSVTICPETGLKFELKLSPSELVFCVKAKIQDLMGIPQDHQELSFFGKELRDALTLSDYNIMQEGAELQLKTHRKENIVLVTIISVLCEAFTLSVHRKMTVYALKQLISSTVGVLFSSQLLLLEGILLENNRRLEDYVHDICEECVLQLVEQPVRIYKIFVSENKVTDFEVSSTSPVLILNEIYPEKKLIFNGRKLHPDHSLGDYNIQRGHLVHTTSQYGTRTIYVLGALSRNQLASVTVNCYDTVLSLKVRIWIAVPSMPPPSQQRLTYNDSPLEDSQILNEFGSLKTSNSVVVSTPQQVLVRCSDGTAITIGVHTTDLVIVLKRWIYKKTGTEPDKQLLFYNGNVMDDDCTIKSYKIYANSLLQLCIPQCVHYLLREMVSSEGRRVLWKLYGVMVTVPPGVIQDGAIMLRVYDGHSATCFEYPPEYTPHSSVYELILASSEQIPPGSVQVTLTKFTPVLPSSRLCLMTASRDPSRWTPDLKPLFSFSELMDNFEINLQEKRVECTLGAAGMYLCVAGTSKDSPSISHQTKRAQQSKSSKLVELCERFELSNGDIEKEVSDEHILEIYARLEKWKRVAAHLGLKQGDVEAVESRAKPDEELMRLYMLQEWKERNKINEAATYQVLLEALLKCSCSNSTVEVCKLLQIAS